MAPAAADTPSGPVNQLAAKRAAPSKRLAGRRCFIAGAQTAGRPIQIHWMALRVERGCKLCAKVRRELASGERPNRLRADSWRARARVCNSIGPPMHFVRAHY